MFQPIAPKFRCIVGLSYQPLPVGFRERPLSPPANPTTLRTYACSRCSYKLQLATSPGCTCCEVTTRPTVRACTAFLFVQALIAFPQSSRFQVAHIFLSWHSWQLFMSWKHWFSLLAQSLANALALAPDVRFSPHRAPMSKFPSLARVGRRCWHTWTHYASLWNKLAMVGWSVPFWHLNDAQKGLTKRLGSDCRILVHYSLYKVLLSRGLIKIRHTLPSFNCML